MEHPLLYQKLGQYRQPDQALWQALSDRTKSMKYEPDQLLLDRGDAPRRIYFVKSGGALGFRWHRDERKLFRIWQQNDLILHIEQGLALRKNNIQIVAADYTTTLELDSKEVQALREQYPEMNYYFDQFTAEEIRYWQDRSFWHQNSDTKQRYYDTVEQYGELYSQLTDKTKATYIGASDRWIRNLK